MADFLTSIQRQADSEQSSKSSKPNEGHDSDKKEADGGPAPMEG